MFTNTGTVQITAKWQEVSGTAIEKLGHTVLDAQHTQHQSYFVVCGGGKLVTRAIDYLNAHRTLASKRTGISIGRNHLRPYGAFYV
ncbi:PD-(D/E)XK nuclease superfamily protein [Escherichia coli]